MIEPCCDLMKLLGRDHYEGVPESDLPDALIEIDREARTAKWLSSAMGAVSIQHCPWCGSQIAGKDSPIRLGQR